MSTKATRSALKRLKEYAHAAMDDGAWNLALSAEQEVEAIERAATNASRGSVTHRLTASDEGLELGLLLELIAKDAK